MSRPRSSYLPLLGHELHVTEWGDPRNPALVMWHGLARTGRDFDELAAGLSDTWFVLCPDTIGRGLSSWSDTPEAHYNLVHYAELALAMLDHYGAGQAAWLGTSMGGMIGIHLAAGAGSGRLRALVINDIGPQIPQPAIDRIVAYAAELPVFATMTEAGAWLRGVYAPFGPAPEAFWQRMTETSIRRRDDGRLTLHYDPRFIAMLTEHPGQLDTWALYQRIGVPTHVIRGARSDILIADIAERMKRTGPRPGFTDYPDCGHAPALARPADIRLVRGLLARMVDGA